MEAVISADYTWRLGPDFPLCRHHSRLIGLPRGLLTWERNRKAGAAGGAGRRGDFAPERFDRSLDRQKPKPVPRPLGTEELPEETLVSLRAHTRAVIGNGDIDCIIRQRM